jgi:hypothetical protein
MCRLSWNLGAWTSWNPQGLSSPVMGLLYLYVYFYLTWISCNSLEITNRIYYSTVHQRFNMFRAAYRSSSGDLTVFAASGLHIHVVTGRSQVWVGIDYGRSPHVYVNQRLQIQLELLMMSGMPLETCWAFSKLWINKFYYKVASCWLFLLSKFEILCIWSVLL